jgi:hypothetical protein
MPAPTIRTEPMIEEILDRISAGETMTAVCARDGMPTLRALLKWLSKDNVLDDAMHRARVRGTLIQADEAIDAQRSIINDTFKGDAKRAQAVVTAANNMGHQANSRLSKIDNRYKDKQQVETVGPMVIGWDTGAVIEENRERPLPDAYLDAITSEDVAN